MKRSMMQAYVTKSVAFYQKAFDAALISSYPNSDGTFYHGELDIQGEILAVAERSSDSVIGEGAVTGSVMQFCFDYGEGNEALVEKAYETLKINAKILVPLAPCAFSPLMVDLIDQYGVRWCLFV